MDSGGRGWIEAPKNSMQAAGAAAFARGERGAQFFIARRPRKKAIEQGAEIKARAAHDNREFPARRDGCQSLAAEAGVVASRKKPIWINNIQQMVRNAAPRRKGDFRRSDVEVTINLL